MQYLDGTLLAWLEGGELEKGSWTLERDLDRETGPLVLNLNKDEDVIIFKLKFGHLTIPEPPYSGYYLDRNTKMAKFKRAYMGMVRPFFVFFYEIFFRMKS